MSYDITSFFLPKLYSYMHEFDCSKSFFIKFYNFLNINLAINQLHLLYVFIKVEHY